MLSRSEFENFVNANAAADLGRAPMIRQFGAYGQAFSTADGNANDVVTWQEIVQLQAQ